MRMTTENLLALAFTFVFVFSLSFFVQPQLALWLVRALLLIQAYIYVSALLDRFRF